MRSKRDSSCVDDAFGITNLGHHGYFERGIEFNYGESTALGAIASKREVGDVGFGISKFSANNANHTWTIVVFDYEEMSANVNVNVELVDLDDTRGFSDYSTRNPLTNFTLL